MLMECSLIWEELTQQAAAVFTVHRALRSPVVNSSRRRMGVVSEGVEQVRDSSLELLAHDDSKTPGGFSSFLLNILQTMHPPVV